MAAKKTAKRTTKKTVKKVAKKTSKRAAKPKVREGYIAHTELVSADPAATKAWAKKTLGWAFAKAMPTETGPYEMFTFAKDMGGGIRKSMGPETPGTIPYVETADIKRTFDKAVKNGATAMMPPSEIPGGMGWIAVVVAPGGPAIGLWSAGK